MQTLRSRRRRSSPRTRRCASCADVSRNLDDEQLLALKKNGGVMQTVAFTAYVKTPPPTRRNARRRWTLCARSSACRRARRSAAGADAARGAARSRRRHRGWRDAGAPRRDAHATVSARRSTRKRRQVNAKFPPPPRATVKDFVDHIDYAVKLIGIDHVGISSDFDGGGGVDGWDGADETFNVTLELVRRGYTEGRSPRCGAATCCVSWTRSRRSRRRCSK